MTPPSVHAPWHDGSTTRPIRCSSATACMLPVASTIPSPTPYAARPSTKTSGHRGQDRRRRPTPRRPAARRAARPRCRAVGRGARPRSDPAPASSTIISRTPDRASSPRSQRSWMRGSRVVRLMKTRPCVRNAAAIASRARPRSALGSALMASIVAGRRSARGRLAACPPEPVPSCGSSATARRSGAVTAAHVDHRPSADRSTVRRRRSRWGRGSTTCDFDLVLTSPRQRARRTAELAGFARRGGRRRPGRVGVRRLRGHHHRRDPRDRAGLVGLDAPVARGRERRRGGGPARPRGRAGARARPHARLRPRPLAARAHRALAGAAGRRRAASSGSTPRPCRCWGSSGRPRCC